MNIVDLCTEEIKSKFCQKEIQPFYTWLFECLNESNIKLIDKRSQGALALILCF